MWLCDVDRYPRSLVARVGLVLALVVVTTGCVAVPTADDPVSDLEERLATEEPPSEIAATVAVREVVDGDERRYTESVWLRADGASRIETTTSDGEFVVVTDGERRYQHDVGDGSVTVIDVDPDAMSSIERHYAQQKRYFETYEVREIEETTLDGRAVYRVAFEPPANETIDRSISVLVGGTEYVVPLETSDVDTERSADHVEVWLDQQSLFPVKHLVEGDGLALETTYRNLSIDPGLADDRFEFELPDPATESDLRDEPDPNDGDDRKQQSAGGTRDAGSDRETGDVQQLALPSIDRHESIEAANAAVPFPVAVPNTESLPDGVTLDGISSYEFPDEDRRQVSLFYRSDDGTVSVTTSDGPRKFATDGVEIDIGDTSGTIARTDEGTELQWSVDGRYYSVFVADSFERSAAVAIANSIASGGK
ncbi:LolA family protein [Halopiger djelfimassiliensis]|uniref:LolA family protein n=1 Tax=Halopiger djelfimassiliensis TaxID=1293047 RepID=UPI000678034F|nr:hypothetical protein [Halopiger djelfimassiliensis]